MSETSVIGNTTVIRGNVRGEGDIEVLGRIEGDLSVTGNITLGEDAQVRGSVSGAMISINGTVSGDITGTVAVVLGEAAHVDGDLITPRVGIAEGARIRGRINTEGAGSRSASESRSADTHARRELPRRGTAPKAPPPRPEPVHVSASKAAHAVPEKRKLPPPPVVPALRKGARARKKVRR